MISTNSLLALFLVVAALPAEIFAQECHTNPDSGDNSDRLTISSPANLSAFDDCTSIIGNIVIDSAFSGSFVLNGVTNVSGAILMDEYEESHEMDAFEMLDLLYIESLNLPQAWGMERLQLPRVEHMEQLYFIQGVEESWFDVGALKTADVISMAGSWTNISFPSLESVSGGLTIVTDPSWSISDRTNPLEIHLPSLQEAQWMSIKGHVNILDTPNLEALGVRSNAAPRGMEVHANYTDLSGVYLTSLEELHGELLLDGHIEAINLNGMYETNATITIRATSPVEIYSGLQDAGIINLSGELSSIGFEDIFQAETMNIESNIASQCPISLIQLYRQLHYPDEPTFCNSGSLSHAGPNTYTYTATSEPTSTSTSTTTSMLDWYYPTAGQSDSDSDSDSGRSGRPPTAVIVLLPLLVGVALLTGIWIFAVRKSRTMVREREREREREMGMGDSAGTPMQEIRHEIRPGGLQGQEQQGSGVGVGGVEIAPPPYSREPPK
ncbi:hypothetical protein BDW59DRAFT_17663 [Aspergillus cavernicola]|uniref:GPI-anchored cell wall organization protein Ecm33 n=1 Tax=Aspergillus cavernicola TaxID=176166 RepID=A0ABR4HHJ3_9EURO